MHWIQLHNNKDPCTINPIYCKCMANEDSKMHDNQRPIHWKAMIIKDPYNAITQQEGTHSL